MKQKLHRSKDNVMLAGVCAGLAESMGWDPTVVRLVVVAVTIFTALIPCLIIYLIAAVIVPKDDGYIDV